MDTDRRHYRSQVVKDRNNLLRTAGWTGLILGAGAAGTAAFAIPHVIHDVQTVSDHHSTASQSASPHDQQSQDDQNHTASPSSPSASASDANASKDSDSGKSHQHRDSRDSADASNRGSQNPRQHRHAASSGTGAGAGAAAGAGASHGSSGSWGAPDSSAHGSHVEGSKDHSRAGHRHSGSQIENFGVAGKSAVNSNVRWYDGFGRQVDPSMSLSPGQKIYSSDGRQRVVVWGDTLSGIAAESGSSVQAIAQHNHIQNPDLIYAGSVLEIPAHR